MKIGVIGYGNLAKALVSGLQQDKNLTFFVTSPALPVATTTGFKTHFNNTAFIKDVDIVILAVKPAKISAVLTEISSKLTDKCLLISLAAGVTLNKLKDLCEHPNQPIIRCMPNTPISVGKGVTALMANSYVDNKQRQLTDSLFKPLSLTMWLTDEDRINAVTALSGSGPAYVYLFLEALADAGVKLGLTEDDANALAKQTLAGALGLLDKKRLAIPALREQVTSKGGTTAAALEVLINNDFSEIIFQALKAAYNRAKTLEQEN